MFTLTVVVLVVIGIALVLAAFGDRRRAREIQRDPAHLSSDPNRTSGSGGGRGKRPPGESDEPAG
jgi:hypothetical protein